MDHEQAIKHCDKIGGIIFVTEASEKTETFISEYVNSNTHFYTYIFSGICTNSSNQWVNSNTNKPIPWNIWKIVTYNYNDSSSETRCLWYNYEAKTFSDSLTTDSLQPICEIPKLKTFLLRGVCKNINVDVYFVMETPELFLGYIFSKIIYSKLENRWELINTVKNNLLAFTEETPQGPPIGANKWNFSDLECRDDGKEFRTLHLHLEVEQPGNFCCFDGSCIKSEFVCDGFSDCQGEEDEKDCQEVILPKYYDRNKAPAKVTFNKEGKVFSPVAIEVTVHIFDIISFKDGSSFELFYDIEFEWLEHSLKFEFLKSSNNVNSIKNTSRIWYPHINFYHIKEEKILEKKITVLRNTSQPPAMSDDTDIVNVREYYEGKDSKLKLSIKMTQEIVCSFTNIRYYPFKDDECQLNFFMEGGFNKFVNFEPLTIKAEENQVVDQYKIKEWKIEEIQRHGDGKVIQISVTFSRELSVIFFVTYLPTIMMNIINQATNYIEDENKGRFS